MTYHAWVLGPPLYDNAQLEDAVSSVRASLRNVDNSNGKFTKAMATQKRKLMTHIYNSGKYRHLTKSHVKTEAQPLVEVQDCTWLFPKYEGSEHDDSEGTGSSQEEDEEDWTASATQADVWKTLEKAIGRETRKDSLDEEKSVKRMSHGPKKSISKSTEVAEEKRKSQHQRASHVTEVDGNIAAESEQQIERPRSAPRVTVYMSTDRPFSAPRTRWHGEGAGVNVQKHDGAGSSPSRQSRVRPESAVPSKGRPHSAVPSSRRPQSALASSQQRPQSALPSSQQRPQSALPSSQQRPQSAVAAMDQGQSDFGPYAHAFSSKQPSTASQMSRPSTATTRPGSAVSMTGAQMQRPQSAVAAQRRPQSARPGSAPIDHTHGDDTQRGDFFRSRPSRPVSAVVQSSRRVSTSSQPPQFALRPQSAFGKLQRPQSALASTKDPQKPPTMPCGDPQRRTMCDDSGTKSQAFGARLTVIEAKKGMTQVIVQSRADPESEEAQATNKELEKFHLYCIHRFGTLARAFKYIDTNGNGSLSISEFVYALVTQLEYCDRYRAARLFAILDADRAGDERGLISAKEFGITRGDKGVSEVEEPRHSITPRPHHWADEDSDEDGRPLVDADDSNDGEEDSMSQYTDQPQGPNYRPDSACSSPSKAINLEDIWTAKQNGPACVQRPRSAGSKAPCPSSGGFVRRPGSRQGSRPTSATRPWIRI